MPKGIGYSKEALKKALKQRKGKKTKAAIEMALKLYKDGKSNRKTKRAYK